MTGRFRWTFVAAASVLVGAVAGCGSDEDVAGVSATEMDTNEDGTVGREVRVSYGGHADAYGELWLPSVPGGQPAPVVVLVHGGFWRDGFLLDLMDPLIPSLLERGYAVWNIEYRRVGAGGGYPSTFDDVAAAVDQLAVLPEPSAALIDLDRVAYVGHSAGGHLAAWAAGRQQLPSDVVGATPMVTPVLVVSQAGVLDLVGCAEQGVGGSACVDLVGAEPDAAPERYAQTSPTELVPFDAVIVAVHGDLDRIVPVSQSATFVERAAAAGMDATLVTVPDADHFSNLDPADPAWAAVLSALDDHL